MGIFEKSPIQRIPQYPKRKPLGGEIRCHYCEKIGMIEVHFRGYRISPGWQIAGNTYVCPECAASVVARVRAILNI